MTRRSSLITYLALCLGPLLLLGPMLLRGETLFWGTPMLQFVPWHRFALDMLRQGQIPLWNPLVGMGAPLLANYQSAVFYPPNVLLLVLGVAIGQPVLVMLHLIWAGLGMRALAARLGLSAPGQMISGLAFSLSGYLIARSGFISINHTAAWLPWVVLCADRLIEAAGSGKLDRNFKKRFLLLSLAFAMQWLAGHAQTAWYSLLMVVAWTIWRFLGTPGPLKRKHVLVALLGSGMLAFVLAAVQLLPTAEYLLQSSRGDVLDTEFALTYSFWPWRLLGLVMPDLFGSPVSGDFWGYGNYWEDAIYIGVLPLLLALAGMIRNLRNGSKKGSPAILLLVVASLALVLAFGKNTPIFPFLFSHIPTFDLFQAPARWNLLMVFSLALMAGFGLDEWRTPTGRGLYWTRLGTAGAAIIGLAGYFGAQALGGVEPTFVRAFAIAGIWLAVSGLFSLFLPKDFSPAIQLTLAAFVLLDLVTAGSGLNPSQPSSVYQGGSALQQLERESGSRLFMPADVEYTVTFERSHRFETFNPGIEWSEVRDAGIPNTPMLDEIPSANNFDPLTTKRYRLLVDALPSLLQESQDALLALMNVAWVAQDAGSGPLGVAYAPVEDPRRIWFFPKAIALASPQAVLEAISGMEILREDVALLEAPPDVGAIQGGPASTPGIARDLPTELEFRVSAPQGTWVVVSDSYYAGWQAQIDGEPTEIFPAFVNLRGIWMPPGEHTIRMLYQPMVFKVGVFLSALGWLVCVVTWLRWRED